MGVAFSFLDPTTTIDFAVGSATQPFLQLGTAGFYKVARKNVFAACGACFLACFVVIFFSSVFVFLSCYGLALLFPDELNTPSKTP